MKKSNMVELEKLPMIPEREVGGDMPDYALVYDILYKRILNGEIRPGELLPSENKMASYWSVSRGTVRTAMRRLEEDGFLIRGQGRPTTISPFVNETRKSASWLYNVCIEDAVEMITSIRMKLSLQKSIDLTAHKLEIPVGERLIGIDLGYYHGAEKTAHTFVTMVPSKLQMFGVSPEKKDELKHFFSTGIYKAAKLSRCILSVMSAGEEPTMKKLGATAPLLAVEGVLFDKDDHPLAYYKHHLNIYKYRFALERRGRG